ncbi:MAG: PD40 domain-containing protein [Chloroflexi bacterium]|nr:PD40 domain-containing protein [Chloroflexota bacterium]
MQAVVSGLLVFVLLMGGGLGSFFTNLAQLIDFARVHPGAQTANILPPDTDAYLTVNLRPGLQQLDKMKQVLSAWLDNPAIKTQTDEQVNKLLTEKGISIQNDILPWLGPEAAIGMTFLSVPTVTPTVAPAPTPTPTVSPTTVPPAPASPVFSAVIAGTYDRAKSDPFVFNKWLPAIARDIALKTGIPLPTAPTGKYRNIDIVYYPPASVYIALTAEYVILSNAQSLLEAILNLYIDKGPSLGNTDGFKTVQSKLPGPKVQKATVGVPANTEGFASTSGPPIANWPFNEGSGNVAHDSSGNGHDLASVNGAGFAAAGISGSAAYLDGIDDRWETAGQGLDGMSQLTINVAIFPTGIVAGRNAGIVTKWGPGGTGDDSYAIVLSPDGRIGVSIMGSQRVDLGSTNPVPLNQWTSIRAVYDGANLKLLINGVLDGSAPAAVGPIASNGQPLYVGRNDWDGQSPGTFNGLIDSVSIVNSVPRPWGRYTGLNVTAGQEVRISATGTWTSGDWTGGAEGKTTPGVEQSLANTKIAFSSDRDGNNEIYVMDADGSNPVNLTNHTAYDVYPYWSPDGSKIAFSSKRDGNDEVYVMNADGSNPVNLSNHTGDDFRPTWSPDGTKIAFNSNRDGNFEIYVMNADGSNQTNLTNNSSTDWTPAAWSPDGTKIAFDANRGGNEEIYVMNADGSNQTNLTNSGGLDGEPAWSPDGTRIAFDSDRSGNFEVYVMNADGSNPVNLTNDSAEDSGPAWSPDGTKIAFRSNRSGNSEIFVMDADGSNQTNLTNNAANDHTPAWSPFPLAPGPMLPGAPRYSLIGKIGDAPPFLVGASFSGIAANSGSLLLGMNDTPGLFADNTGNVTANVTVIPTSQPPAMFYLNVNRFMDILITQSNMKGDYNGAAMLAVMKGFVPAYMGGAFTFVDGGIRTDYYYAPPAGGGGYPAGTTPGKTAALTPGNVLGFYSTGDIKAMWDWFKPIMAKQWPNFMKATGDPNTPTSLDAFLKAWKEYYGFDLEADVFSLLTGEVAYSWGPHVARDPIRQLWAAEIADDVLVASKIQMIISGINNYATKTGGNTLELVPLTLEGLPVTQIKRANRPFDKGIDPHYAFVTVDNTKYLIFGLNQAAVSSALRTINNPSQALAQNGSYQWQLNNLPSPRNELAFFSIPQILGQYLPIMPLDKLFGTTGQNLAPAILGQLQSLGLTEVADASGGRLGTGFLRVQKTVAMVSLDPVKVQKRIGDTFSVDIRTDEIWPGGVSNMLASKALFADDFEADLPEGTTYPAGWTNMFAGVSGAVSTEQFASGAKSFRLEGTTTVPRTDFVPFVPPDDFGYSAAVFPTGLDDVGVGFTAVQDGNNPFFNTIEFRQDGKIHFRGVADTILQPYEPGKWYRVAARINHVANTADVFVDRVLKGDDLAVRPRAEVPNDFGLSVRRGVSAAGVAYFDDVRLSVPIPGGYRSTEFSLGFATNQLELIDVVRQVPAGVDYTDSLVTEPAGRVSYNITVKDTSNALLPPAGKVLTLNFRVKGGGESNMVLGQPKLTDNSGAPIPSIWRGSQIRTYELPAIVKTVSTPPMVAIMGMFKGGYGPEGTNLIVEVNPNRNIGGVGVAHVRANLKQLLLGMLPADFTVPPERQAEWDSWLKYLENWELWKQAPPPLPKPIPGSPTPAPAPAPGEYTVFSRYFSLWELLGKSPLQSIMGEYDMQRLVARLKLGNFTIPVTVSDYWGNVVTGQVSLSIVDMLQALKLGWNLVSIPVKLDDAFSTWQAILNLGDGLRVSDALRYDPELGWLGLGPTDRLKPQVGVYMYATENDQLPSVFSRSPSAPPATDMKDGWGLFGVGLSPTEWDSMPVKEAMASLEFDMNGNRGYSVVVSPGTQFNYNQEYRYVDMYGRTYYYGGYGWNFKQDPWVYTVNEWEGATPKTLKVGGGAWVFRETALDTLAGFSTTPVTMVSKPKPPEPGHDIGIVPRYNWEPTTRTTYETYQAPASWPWPPGTIYTKTFVNYTGNFSPSKVFEFYKKQMPQFGWQLTNWDGQIDRATMSFHREVWSNNATPPMVASYDVNIQIGNWGWYGNTQQQEITILLERWEPGADLPDVPRYDWQPVAMTFYQQLVDNSGTHTNIWYQGNVYPPDVFKFYTDGRMNNWKWAMIDGKWWNDGAYMVFQRVDEKGQTNQLFIGVTPGLIKIEHHKFIGTPPAVFYDNVYLDGQPLPAGTPLWAVVLNRMWQPMPAPTPANLRGIWGTDSKNIFAVGDAGTILRFDGNVWMPMASGTAANLKDIWGSSGNDVFAVGDEGTILHYDGTVWSPMDVGTTANLQGIHGSAGNDVVVVGDSGTVLHFDGNVWEPVPAATADNLGDVWGGDMPLRHVFVSAASRGAILKIAVDTGQVSGEYSTSIIRRIWGASPTDVYATGAGGTILHYNGTAWNPMTSGTTANLTGVSGVPGKEIFAVGEAGTILQFRYDGKGWGPLASNSAVNLTGVWTMPGSDVFAVGEGGTVLRYGWAEAARFPARTIPFNGLPGLPPPGAFQTVPFPGMGYMVSVPPDDPLTPAIEGGKPGDPIVFSCGAGGYGEVISNEKVYWSASRPIYQILTINTPVNAPTNLVATAVVGPPPAVTLTWTDNSANEMKFVIDRSTDGVNFSVIGGVAANLTTYTDATVAAGTTYFYRVTAVSNTNKSPPSNVISVTVPTPPSPLPAAPTNLTAVAGGPTQVTLAWTDNATNETGFRIERATAETFTTVVITNVGADVTTFTDNTVVAGTTYFYRVFAFNGAGTSAPSNVVSVTTPAAPPPPPPPAPPASPTGLTAIAAGPTLVNLAWVDNSGDETGFRIERATDEAFTTVVTTTVGANVTTFSDNTVVGGTAYFYRVFAFNAVGNRPPSNVATVTTPAP